MEIIRHDVEIKISTEFIGNAIVARVERQDKFRSTYYGGVSLASVERLRSLANRLARGGLKTVGNAGIGDGRFWCIIVLQEKSRHKDRKEK